MVDQPVREIQLGGKQIVFLFMLSVVVAVGIFLLGISVGRGVRAGGVGAMTLVEAAPARDAVPPAVMPPPTETTAADLAYHDHLQEPAGSAGAGTSSAAKASDMVSDKASDKAVEPPAPVDEAVPTPAAVPLKDAAAAVKSTAAAPAPAPKASAPAPKASAPAAAKASAPAAPAKAAGWMLQVGAFSSRANADKLVTRLKGKGYAASVVSGNGSALYRVRVGPYDERTEAERAATRLRREEGFKPAITR